MCFHKFRRQLCKKKWKRVRLADSTKNVIEATCSSHKRSGEKAAVQKARLYVVALGMLATRSRGWFGE
jgi:hypothetical protein